MAGPVIVIEAPEARQSAAYAQSLIDACQVGLKETRCVLALETSSQGPAAIATVAWRGSSGLDALVEVGRRRGDRPLWLTRELHFRPVDDPAERWKAVGFTIATLAVEVAPEEIQQQPQTAERDTSGAQPTSATAASDPPAAIAIAIPEPSAAQTAAKQKPRPGPAKRDAAATHASTAHSGDSPFSVLAGIMLGPGFEMGAWRVGGWLGSGYRFRDLPVGVRSSVAYALRPQDSHGVSAQWLSVSLGPSVHVPLLLDAGAVASAEFVAEGVTVSAEALGGDTDAGGRWVLGGKASAGLVWPRRGIFAALLLAEVSRLSGGTAILLRDERLASSPAANYALRLGFEWRLGSP